MTALPYALEEKNVNGETEIIAYFENLEKARFICDTLNNQWNKDSDLYYSLLVEEDQA